MLGWRLGISAVLIPALIGLFFWDATWPQTAPILLALSLLLACRATWELVGLLGNQVPGLAWRPLALANMLIVLSAWSAHWHADPELARWLAVCLVASTFTVCVLALFLVEAARFQQPGAAMANLSAGVLVLVYCGVLLAMTAQLRWIQTDLPYLALASLVIGVKMGDVGGYTFGRLFGKRKLIPRLSPGKTRAGGVGAVATAAVATWLWFTIAANWLEVPVCGTWAFAYGAMLGIIGLIGDLCESLIKRDVQQKDSSELLPGFGGLLDLLDSILYTGPVAWMVWVVSESLGWVS